ncbi:helix-turn-helix transcriptional regulator [Thiomicrorhabdus indica]|uniref:helix-turn-helix transcriptional regulator n=1 Tax=Thiomicrorhabdus indica TaxID=2267253 RepID=UPI00102DD036|nr:AlpA family phage regulatory protein [Thiomicrorhabdus indica]
MINKNLKLIKLPEVLNLCAISKTTLYRLVNEGGFPNPVQLSGKRSVAWRYREVEAWIESRVSVKQWEMK